MTKFLILLLISTTSFALKPHTAEYSLSMSGLDIAKETRTLRFENGIYYYDEHAKTTGWASLIKDYEITASSVFTLDTEGLHAQKYKILERSGKKIKKNYAITLTENTIDPLSLFMALSHELRMNPEKNDFNFIVNTGNKIKPQHYVRTQSDEIGLIKIVNPAKNIVAYFDRNQHYLPVKISKKKFGYQLKSVTFSP
jgi:hypothetical protein